MSLLKLMLPLGSYMSAILLLIYNEFKLDVNFN